MLKFNKILDMTTRTRYAIQRVTVMDAGTDEHPESTFEVDMLSDDDELLCDVVICTSGDGSVCINRNLGRDGCTDTVEGVIENKTLIITAWPGMLDEAAYLDHMTAAMQHLTRLWQADGVPPEEMVRRLQNAFQERLPKVPLEDDSEDEPMFRVTWNDHEGIQQERWFTTLRDAIYEEIDLNGKYDGVKTFDADGNEVKKRPVGAATPAGQEPKLSKSVLLSLYHRTSRTARRKLCLK